MRRGRVAKRLRGQLLLLDSDPDGVTVDCLLGDSDGAVLLVTLSFSVSPGTLAKVLHVLRDWEDRNAPVEVMIADGRRGPQVEISSANGRLVLTRRD